MQQTYNQLTTIMRETFDDDNLIATPTLTADQVDGWDSLAHVRLMTAVERAFGVRFAAYEVTSFRNVGDLVGLISRKTTSNSRKQ